MVYEIYQPAGVLRDFIESFVYYRDFNPEHSVDRFLPDGNVNVVIDLTDYPKFIYDNYSLKEIQACRHVWFSGIRSKFITIPSGRDSEMFIINFHKGKAYPFVEMPLDVLTDTVIDGQLVMTDALLDLRGKLLEIADTRTRFLEAERSLEKQFLGRLRFNPFVDYAVNQLLYNPQLMTLEALSRKVGYSQKHLISIFKSHVGVSPKAFLRIMRFQGAVQAIEQRKNVQWSTLALDSGYFDQAHFIHDFKTFSGFTPAEFQSKQGDFTNYVPVG